MAEWQKNTRNMAYAGGFRNVGWITGRLIEIQANVIFLRTDRIEIIPIKIDSKLNMSNWKVGDMVTLTCRIKSEIGYNHKQTPVLEVIQIERPDLLLFTTTKAVQLATETDHHAVPHMNQNSNKIEIAGLVHSIHTIARPPGILILLRCESKSGREIPVKVYSKHAAQYRQKLKVSTPVLIEGFLNVYMGKSDGNPALMTEIRVKNVRAAQEGKDIVFPAWAKALLLEAGLIQGPQ